MGDHTIWRAHGMDAYRRASQDRLQRRGELAAPGANPLRTCGRNDPDYRAWQRRQRCGHRTREVEEWRHRPYGAITELYAEIYEGTVQERTNNAIGPIEGGNDIDAEIRLVRSPFFGADELIALISAQTVTNTHTGNVLALGVYFGEMKAEGQPLNIRVAKPTAQVAETLFLASVLSRTARTVANAQSTASTSTGVSFTATSAIDVAALRTNNAAVLHLLARFSALTLPAQGQVQATVKTAAGNTLWQSTWKPLGSNTSGQLIDLGEAPLTMLRLPVPSAAAANITITVAIRSVTTISRRCSRLTSAVWSRPADWRPASAMTSSPRRI